MNNSSSYLLHSRALKYVHFFKPLKEFSNVSTKFDYYTSSKHSNLRHFTIAIGDVLNTFPTIVIGYGTRTKWKLFPIHTTSIHHGVLVGVGSI
jgi:hypothetical protein